MSGMFNYKDVASLFAETKDWQPLSNHSTQHYALKFVFGEIDAARRLLASQKATSSDFSRIENRIKMLKMLAKTVAELPITSPHPTRSRA